MALEKELLTLFLSPCSCVHLLLRETGGGKREREVRETTCAISFFNANKTKEFSINLFFQCSWHVS